MTTPLQQALTYACLENAGKIMKPCYTLDEEPEVWIDTGTSQENIDFIKNALRDAVTVQHPSADASDVGANVTPRLAPPRSASTAPPTSAGSAAATLTIHTGPPASRLTLSKTAAALTSTQPTSQLRQPALHRQRRRYVPSGIETEENADAGNAEAAE